MLQSKRHWGQKAGAAAGRGQAFPLCPCGNKTAAGLTHSAQRTDSSIVLSWQVLLVAHGAHAISPGVAIETTAGGTEHRNWALIGLLGHSDVCRQVSWPGDTNKKTHTAAVSVCFAEWGTETQANRERYHQGWSKWSINQLGSCYNNQ